MKNRYGTIILSIIAALALSAFLAVPALAHHKDGHDNGSGSEPEAAPEEQTSEEQTSEEDASEESSEQSTDERSRTGYRTGTSGTREPEPDPTPSQTDPSNKGPADCDDYSQEDNGPYDHDSCDGTQGMNGSDGNGKCAGCTGKADDKSPGGQSRNDHNNGYECDNNGGVGKGNPPHARCPIEPPPTVCLTNCVPPANVCPPGTDMAGLPPGPNGCDVEKRIDKVCPPGTDRAGEDMTNLKDCDDEVLPNVITRRVQPVGPRPEVQAGAVLPFTGAGSVTTFAALGFLLIGLGALSLRARKTT